MSCVFILFIVSFAVQKFFSLIRSACNAGDLDLIPGLGRSSGEGKGYHPVFLPGEFHGLYSPWGRRVGRDSVTFTFRSHLFMFISITLMQQNFMRVV